jgi:hypothetical protein
MWIRSQDKRELIKTANIGTNEVSTGKCAIWADGAVRPLGIYETEARALQILDEIHKAICYTKRTELFAYSLVDMSDEFMMQFVFEMPEN